MNRVAQFHCGQVHLTCNGDPRLVVSCHCLLCQRRTGSVIHVAAWYRKERVQFEGTTKAYTRTAGDQEIPWTFHFCPECGTSVWWEAQSVSPDIGIGVGCFADPEFPPPTYSVYNKHRHPRVTNPKDSHSYAELPDQETIQKFKG